MVPIENILGHRGRVGVSMDVLNCPGCVYDLLVAISTRTKFLTCIIVDNVAVLVDSYEPSLPSLPKCYFKALIFVLMKKVCAIY